MDHDEASRIKLSMEELGILILVYQGKFNSLYLQIKNDLSRLKSDFSKLEALEYK